MVFSWILGCPHTIRPSLPPYTTHMRSTGSPHYSVLQATRRGGHESTPPLPAGLTCCEGPDRMFAPHIFYYIVPTIVPPTCIKEEAIRGHSAKYSSTQTLSYRPAYWWEDSSWLPWLHLPPLFLYTMYSECIRVCTCTTHRATLHTGGILTSTDDALATGIHFEQATLGWELWDNGFGTCTSEM